MNRRAVDALMVTYYSPSHPRGNMFRKISLIWEIPDKRNLAAIDEFMAPDYIEHDEMPPGTPAGAEGLKQMMGMFFSAFPDMQSTTEDVIAEGDKVVGRHVFSATHTGDFMGIPATGKRINIGEMHIVRIVNGKGVEHWGQVDMMGMMQQLGVVPSP